jgi:hypothetical protein
MMWSQKLSRDVPPDALGAGFQGNCIILAGFCIHSVRFSWDAEETDSRASNSLQV